MMGDKFIGIQRGIGRAAVVLLVLAVSVIVAGCGGSKASPSAEGSGGVTPATAMPAAPTSASLPASPTPKPTATLAPSATPTSTSAPTAASDPRQAILDAFQAVLKAGPYRVKSTTTTDGGNTVTITGEVILPDRFHLVTNQQEFLIVGNKTYQKTGGKWSEFPVDIGSIVSSLTGGLNEEFLKNLSDIVSLGPDTVNGTPAQVYQYTSTVDLGGETVKSSAKLWIATASGLPLQQDVDGEYAGIKSHTHQEYTFDPSIKIEAPTN